MSINDDDRKVSHSWTLKDLKAAKSSSQAADYLADFWGIWIASPMLKLGGDGWAQLTLACLAVEATAQFWLPTSKWSNTKWRGKKVYDMGKKELRSEASFCRMFCEIFDGCEPQSIALRKLAEVVYKVFRCGLAHRGLSKDCLNTKWLGVIDGQGVIFKDLSFQVDPRTLRFVLSIDPNLFAPQVDNWFKASVLKPLAASQNPDVASAFKEWCSQRWGISMANWSF